MEYEALLKISTMTLATCGKSGEPHAAPVYFVAVRTPALHLYFYSQVASQHIQDIQSEPRTAAAIYPEVQDWQEIRGLQMRGKIYLVIREDERDSAQMAYLEKFPFVKNFASALESNELYCFTPTWVRLVDNRLGFGYKQEWEFV